MFHKSWGVNNIKMNLSPCLWTESTKTRHATRPSWPLRSVFAMAALTARQAKRPPRLSRFSCTRTSWWCVASLARSTATRLALPSRLSTLMCLLPAPVPCPCPRTERRQAPCHASHVQRDCRAVLTRGTLLRVCSTAHFALLPAPAIVFVHFNCRPSERLNRLPRLVENASPRGTFAGCRLSPVSQPSTGSKKGPCQDERNQMHPS